MTKSLIRQAAQCAKENAARGRAIAGEAVMLRPRPLAPLRQRLVAKAALHTRTSALLTKLSAALSAHRAQATPEWPVNDDELLYLAHASGCKVGGDGNKPGKGLTANDLLTLRSTLMKEVKRRKLAPRKAPPV